MVHDIQGALKENSSFVLESEKNLLKWCEDSFQKGDICVFFSSSDFLQVPEKLMES